MVWKAVPKGWPLILFGAMAAMTFSNQAGPIAQMSRSLSAFASVAEGGADLAVSAMLSTGTITSSATSWAATSIASAQLFGAEMWNGRDLTNVALRSVDGVIVAESASAILLWAVSPAGMRLHEGDDSFLDTAADCLASLRREVPFLEVSARTLHSDSNYSFTTIAAFWAPSGMVSLRWSRNVANYSVQWANPLWELMQLSPTEDVLRINLMLDSYFRTLPRPPQNPPLAITINNTVSQALAFRAEAWSRFFYNIVFGAPLLP